MNMIFEIKFLRHIHLTSVYLVKTCLFYISVLSNDVEEAVRWAIEVLKLSKVIFTRLKE